MKTELRPPGWPTDWLLGKQPPLGAIKVQRSSSLLRRWKMQAVEAKHASKQLLDPHLPI